MAIKVDNTVFAKELKKTRFRLKMVVMASVMAAVIVLWLVLTVALYTEPVTHPNLTGLTKPFKFSVNEEVFALLETKTRFTDEQLSDFPIFIINNSGWNTRAMDIIIANRDNSDLVTPPEPDPEPWLDPDNPDPNFDPNPNLDPEPSPNPEPEF